MRRFIAPCFFVLIAMVLLGACGGSEEESPRSSDRNAIDTAGGSSSDSDFAKLYADMTKQRFKITFVDDNGDEQTYAQDGKGNSAYGSGDTQYFRSADRSVSCNLDPGYEATCTQVPDSGAAISPFLRLLQNGKAAIDALGGAYGDTSSKTIAGRDAKCLTISLGASASYCIDRETGVLLEIAAQSASGKDVVSFKVTKYEEPSDSDFRPPAPIATPGVSYPTGYTGPTIPGPD